MSTSSVGAHALWLQGQQQAQEGLSTTGRRRDLGLSQPPGLARTEAPCHRNRGSLRSSLALVGFSVWGVILANKRDPSPSSLPALTDS